MEIFVRCKRYGADAYLRYEGQTAETAIRLLTELGATDITVITETEWNANSTGR